MTKFVDLSLYQNSNTIFIHGIGAAKDAWRLLVTQLSKHFTVITYDLLTENLPFNLDFTLNDLIADLEN